MEVLKSTRIDMKSYLGKELAELINVSLEKKIKAQSKKKMRSLFGQSLGRVVDRTLHSFIEGVPHEMVDQMIKVVLEPSSQYMLFSRVMVKSVLYQSVGSNGQSVETLSGLVIIPHGNAGNPSMPIMAYQHGTTLSRKLAPSNFDKKKPFNTTTEVIIAMLFASLNGYIVTMADYQGLGVSKEIQPYVGAEPLAASVLDLVLATKEYLNCQSDIHWNKQVFLLGYSQGGYVTMAAAKAIQENPKYALLGEYLKASAPCAGPYCLSSVMRFLMLRKEQYPFGVFLVMAIRGYYAQYGNIGDGIFSREKAFKQAYWSLWDMADGSKTMQEVNAKMPSVPRDILSQEMINQLSDTNSCVGKILKENDLDNWIPQTALQLYQSPRDGLVPFENSLKAHQFFQSKNANVGMAPMFFLPMGKMIPMPLANRTHVEAGLTCLLAAYSWFTPIRFRQQEHGILQANEFLLYGQNLASENKKYCLSYQMDGNLSFYDKETGKQLWQAGIVNENTVPKVCLVKQYSECAQSMVSYSIYKEVFTTLNPGICIIQQKEGKFIVYDNAGEVMWFSNTKCANARVLVSDDGVLSIEDQQGRTLKTLYSGKQT